MPRPIKGKNGVYYYLKTSNLDFIKHLASIANFESRSKALDHIIEFYRSKHTFIKAPKKAG